MEIFIFIILGIVCGATISFLALHPKLKIANKENLAIQQMNEKLQKDNEGLLIENDSLTSKRNKLLMDNVEAEKALKQVEILVSQKKEEQAQLHGSIEAISRNIEDMQIQAEKHADDIYKNAMLVMQDSFERQAEAEAKKFQDLVALYNKEYGVTVKEATDALNSLLGTKKERIEILKTQCEDLESKISLAIAANKREQEIRDNTSFYTIGLSDIDIQEVKRIKEVIPYLRNGRPISKAIWECYYRNATNELLNRVIGTGTHSGIYKITCLLDKKVYIGQARDLRDRWTTHIKCGLGIDTTNAQLYKAMIKNGVENFTFEVVEECAAADLNKQEKYWIEYFHAQEWGYNQTAGGSRS